MRLVFASVLLVAVPVALAGQATGHFPPDSLVNTKVIPHGTPVVQVIGMMRNFAIGLGVRCTYCHVGEEGKPLDQVDFPNDQKRTKLVARQMMLMVAEINRRVDTLPGRTADGITVTCATCHHGNSKPITLSSMIADAATAGGTDSAVRAYRAARQRYYGRDTYDFGEGSLNSAALRLARAGKFDEAFALLTLNEEFYPASSDVDVFRGNISLLKGDTTAAAKSFGEAIQRDPGNREAAGRLRDIGRKP